ncbi:SDR family oxidoreductase [Nonomuraea sp. NPDC049684]|uniref:SDR family oxidoreductase n=1 Tax=Nonomuraea sp. NPDC049684 TaxID=3364356 RepID=UPI0037A593FF
MGAASAAALAEAGHTVIGVDLRDADIIADLDTAEGRNKAAGEILSRCEGRLEGVAAVAGVGPNLPDAATVLSIDYFGPVRLLDLLRPALAASGAGRAVVIGSNSATTVPLSDDRLVELALAGQEEAAREHARAAAEAMPAELRELAPSTSAYASAKFALARWVRRTAVTPEWARHGVLLNAIAPGAVLTPLMLGSAGGTGDADDFPTPMPLGVFGEPVDIAFWVHQFLKPEARFTTGATMRPDAQPVAMTMGWQKGLDQRRGSCRARPTTPPAGCLKALCA